MTALIALRGSRARGPGGPVPSCLALVNLAQSSGKPTLAITLIAVADVAPITMQFFYQRIRRRPAPGAAVAGPAQLPEGWHEFAGRELGAMLGLARDLEVYLPGTKAAFRTGILSQDKAAIIAAVTALLDPAEARAAEAMVLDRAGSLTPGALRAAIGRAVMEVAPAKAKARREHMAKRTRVERWAEDSGNAGLAGRELPPAEVLAADQRVTAWARQLRKAGLEGGMDQLTELVVCLEGIG